MRDFAVKGKSKVIKLFLEKDEIRELKLQNNLGYTPVMSATQVNNLEDWFLELKKQESETKNLSSSSMKELICRGAKGGVDFKSVLAKKSKFGNTLLMKLAMKMKDEALREILTNTITSKYVSFTTKTLPKFKLFKYSILFFVSHLGNPSSSSD